MDSSVFLCYSLVEKNKIEKNQKKNQPKIIKILILFISFVLNILGETKSERIFIKEHF